MYDFSFYQACMGQTQLVFNLKKTMVLVRILIFFCRTSDLVMGSILDISRLPIFGSSKEFLGG
jgi:hypothetical protein